MKSFYYLCRPNKPKLNTMKKIVVFLFAILALAACQKEDNRTPRECVDPMVGTGAHGHTFPGATVPHGAVQLSPDTRSGNWDAASGYHYSDSALVGFSHNHLSGTGCTDLGDVLVRPTYESIDSLLVTSKVDQQNSPGDQIHPVTFSHDNEHAEAGYYSVTLDDGISCELTATTHCGIHRYAFDAEKNGSLVFDMTHLLSAEDCVVEMEVNQTGENEVSGYRVTNGWSPNRYIFFFARFSKPISEIEETNVRGILGVHFEKADTVEVQVGVSQVSEDGARLNLETECGKTIGEPQFSFETLRAAAQKQWDDALGKIEVKGGSKDERTNFYTALYHTMVAPNIVSDVDGKYRRNNDQIAQVPEGQERYSTLSLWDTFRALHPLLTLVDSALVSNICYSMLDMYEAQGQMPLWPLASGETECMIGYHSASVVADAYLKGIWPAKGDEATAQKALAALVHSSKINKKGGEAYTNLGYIPSDKRNENVSCCLEYSYDDWCIARMAEKLGNAEVAEEYYERANNYQHVFDGQTSFFRGKRADGNWSENFNSFEPGRDYTEATAWQYRFGALHDIYGMMQLYGGQEKFVQQLDSLFIVSSKLDGEVSDITGLIGQYAHGNEPSHHMAYLYNYVGQPWKTQEMTRRLLKEMYQATPEGISGNEDCGQMSAWYVMTAMGLYNVAPGSKQYDFTTPLFSQVTIHLYNGKTLSINAGKGKTPKYIEKAEFVKSDNSTEELGNFVQHDLLMEGGTLNFTLTSSPNKERGIDAAASAMSLSTKPAASVPYVDHDLFLFIDQVDVKLATLTDGAEIHYTLDGTEPTASSPVYKQPIHLTETAEIKAIAIKKDYDPSCVMTVKATKAVYRPAVSAEMKEKGSNYIYVEGYFSKVADLDGGVQKDSGTMPEPSLDKKLRGDHFGYIFKGVIDVPEEGIYVFATKTDDGSVLYIDDELVVDNDGSHAAITATGRIPLTKGPHTYKFLYLEDYEGESLEWFWQLPSGKELVKIPAGNLYVK